jgi:hypothetical protein
MLFILAAAAAATSTAASCEPKELCEAQIGQEQQQRLRGDTLQPDGGAAPTTNGCPYKEGCCLAASHGGAFRRRL